MTHHNPLAPGLIKLMMLLFALTACSERDNRNDEPPAGPDRPSVLSVLPEPGATGVALNVAVHIRFNRPMNCTTLTTETFTLSGAEAVSGSVACSGDTAIFIPTTLLSANTTYTATVTTGARDLQGNGLAATWSWSFTTGNAKAWGQAVLLETADGDAGAPTVAADRLNNNDSDGDVIVAWAQDDGTQLSIFSNRYTGGAWTGSVPIENESANGYAGGASSPRAVMSQNGDPAVVWGYNDGEYHYSVWFNEDYGTHGVWAQAEQVSPLGGGNASRAQLALDAGGNYLFAVWSQYLSSGVGGNYRIMQRQQQRCSDGSLSNCVGPTGWSDASAIDAGDVGDASEPQVAAWGDRNAVAVWTQGITGGRNEIWASVATSGTWGAPVRINTGSTNPAGGAPVVAVDSSGNAVAAWYEFASPVTFYASRYSNGSWSAPVVIRDPSGGEGAYQSGGPGRIQVAMNPYGDALFVWAQSNSSYSLYNIHARRCPAGPLSGCEAPVLLETSDGTADLPQLAMDAGGNAVAVWKQQDGTATRVYANLYTAGSHSWNATPDLAGGAAVSGAPQVAIDGNGNVTVVWTEYESGRYNLYANRYE
jgi:hypothetical protein